MKFKFSNLFKPEPPSLTQIALDNAKAGFLEIIGQALNSVITGAIGNAQPNIGKKYRIIMSGKAVEEVHADPKEEEDDQDAIYSAFMAMMNGDRDVVYDVPPEIEIKAFDNDKRTDEERDEIYNIIDAINEANDISRDGTFRTHESVMREEEESRRIAEMNTTNNIDMTLNLKASLFPVIHLSIICLSSMISLGIMEKMAKIIDKI